MAKITKQAYDMAKTLLALPYAKQQEVANAMKVSNQTMSRIARSKTYADYSQSKADELKNLRAHYTPEKYVVEARIIASINRLEMKLDAVIAEWRNFMKSWNDTPTSGAA